MARNRSLLQLIAACSVATGLAVFPGCEREIIEENPSEFVGVGVELTMEAAGARVERLLPGGAASTANVKVGDVFLEVDGRSLRGQSLANVVKLLRGEEGTEVKVLSRTAEGNVMVAMQRRHLKNPGAP